MVERDVDENFLRGGCLVEVERERPVLPADDLEDHVLDLFDHGGVEPGLADVPRFDEERADPLAARRIA